MGKRGAARLSMMALAAMTAAATSAARGQTLSNWSSGVSGSWTDGARWSTQPDYPNNGVPAGTTYAATIDAAPVTGPYTVTLGGGANVSVNALALNHASAILAITGGSSLTTIARTLQTGTLVLNNGTLNLPGDNDRLLGGGTIRFDGTGGLVDFYDAANDPASNPSIQNVTVRTGTGSGSIRTEYGATLWFEANAVADTAGRQLSLLSGLLRNYGTISASNGAILRLGHPHPGLRGTIDNFGSITVNNATLELASQFSFKGNVSVTNSTLKVGGEKWAPAEILALPLASNSLWIKGGTVDVTNTTFQLSAATGSIILDDALFTGAGRLTAQAGYEYISRSTDPVDHPSMLFNSTLAAPLRITNGDQFWGNTMLVDGATIRLESIGDRTRLNFGGASTFTGTGTVIFEGTVIAGTSGNAIYNHVGAFTLGAGITVTTGTASGVIGSTTISTDPIVNQGAITAVTAGRTITIAPRTFTNTGVIEARNGGTVTVAGGTTVLTNVASNTLTGGEYRIAAGSTLSFGSRTFTTNAAKVVLEGAGSVFNAVAPLASNTGTFEIDKGRNFTTVGSLANSGTLRVGKDSTLTVNGALTNTGKLKGNGTIVTAGTSSSGTIAPGDSPGLLALSGNLTMTPTSILEIEIGGTTPGVGFDLLDVGGNLVLDGTLAISFVNGFSPGPNDVFDFLDFASASGAFDSVTVPTLPPGVTWDLAALASGGPAGVPEPATAALLASATFALFAGRRRRSPLRAA